MRHFVKDRVDQLPAGFEPREIESWFEASGLLEFELETVEGHARSRELPSPFLASGRRPAPSRT